MDINAFIRTLAENFNTEVAVAISKYNYKGEFRQFVHEAKQGMKKRKQTREAPVQAFIYETDRSGKTRIQIEYNDAVLAA